MNETSYEAVLKYAKMVYQDFTNEYADASPKKHQLFHFDPPLNTWLVRARSGKYLKLSDKHEWQEVNELFNQINTRAKSYDNAYITKDQPRSCRVITKRGSMLSKRKKPKKLPRNYNSGGGNYQRLAKEPWILATNLPKKYNTTQVLNSYKKRMQIEICQSYCLHKNKMYINSPL